MFQHNLSFGLEFAFGLAIASCVASGAGRRSSACVNLGFGFGLAVAWCVALHRAALKHSNPKHMKTLESCRNV